jgi:hypothetical protein
MGTIIFAILLVAAWVGWVNSPSGRAALERARQADQRKRELKASQESRIVCPHCQTAGRVTTSAVTLKKGVSGAKATAALFTAGTSMVVTGLSRKEAATEARCSNCGQVWHY